MSNQVPTDMVSHNLVKFWGGDERGFVVQVISNQLPVPSVSDKTLSTKADGFVTLTMEEACALCNNLGEFIIEECKRRQALLDVKIKDLGIDHDAVLKQVSMLDPALFRVRNIVTNLVAKLCPITYKRKPNEQTQ